MPAPLESDRAPAPDAADGAPPARRAERSARALARLALLALLVVGAAGVYAWLDMRRDLSALRGDVAQRLAAADAADAQARARESDLANLLREVQAKLALLEARLAESQSQQAALDALYRDLAPSREALALTEVEQVLSLAAQQLTLAGNVQAALAALQLADAKLGRLDRPQFTPLRRALARDMDRLKAVPYVDVAGISVKLDQALDAIDELPLARDERLAAPPRQPAKADDPRWMTFLRDAWADLRGIVRIEVSDRPPAPLLAPQQTYFLRENLRLRLLAARLALLSRDERGFRADVNAARSWLERYFDTRAQRVQTVASSLNAVAAVPMAAEVPDLSASLEAVRTLRAVAERTAAPAVAPAPRAR